MNVNEIPQKSKYTDASIMLDYWKLREEAVQKFGNRLNTTGACYYHAGYLWMRCPDGGLYGIICEVTVIGGEGEKEEEK